MKLKDKVAIVTGGASGIGKATAITMAREGACVMIGDLNLERAQDTVREISESGGRAMAVQADIGDYDQVMRMVDQTVAHFGRVDILANIAALKPVPSSPIQERELSAMEEEISITLTGAIRCCKAVIPHLLEQRSGRIISVTSEAGRFGTPTMSVYSCCKAGIAGFSRAIAQELATHGVTVNCVAPGPIKTPGMLQHLKAFPEHEKDYVAGVAVGHMGEPEDVANMIVFLASDDAKFITGEEFLVNGGKRAL